MSMMRSRNITLLGDGRIDITVEEVRKPKENEVTVHAHTSLVSNGSETFHRLGRFEEGMHWADMRYPCSTGYTVAGVVTAVGEDVKGLSVGDRVYSRSPHKEYSNVEQERVGKLPDDISFEEGSWLPVLRVADCAYRVGGFQLGQDVVIAGLGIFGLSCVQYGLLAGARRIIGIDPNPNRCELAVRSGATHIINDEAVNCVERLREILDGNMAEYVIDSTGSAAGLSEAGELTGRMAKIILVSDNPNSSKQIVGRHILMKYLRIYGIHYNMCGIYQPNAAYPMDYDRVHAAMFDYIRQKRIHLGTMVTDRLSPEAACALYGTLDRRDCEHAGMVIDWLK